MSPLRLKDARPEKVLLYLRTAENEIGAILDEIFPAVQILRVQEPLCVGSTWVQMGLFSLHYV